MITTRVYREKFVGTGTDENPHFPEVDSPSRFTFQITDTKLYVPVVTLSTEDDNKCLEQLKTGFKRTIKWDKYRSEVTKQIKINNWNYLIDPTFNKFNILFVLLFENEDHKKDHKRLQCIDWCKSFFDVPIKIKKEHTKRLLKWVKIMIIQMVIY